MGRIPRRLPSPTMIVAIAALIAALTGSAYAGSRLTLGSLTESAKAKTVGVGKLTYVSNVANVPVNLTVGTDVASTCPSGTHVIGGGIRVGNDQVQIVNDSHPTAAGWAGTVFNAGALPHTATATAICAQSRSVTGAP